MVVEGVGEDTHPYPRGCRRRWQRAVAALSLQPRGAFWWFRDNSAPAFVWRRSDGVIVLRPWGNCALVPVADSDSPWQVMSVPSRVCPT